MKTTVGIIHFNSLKLMDIKLTHIYNITKMSISENIALKVYNFEIETKRKLYLKFNSKNVTFET